MRPPRYQPQQDEYSWSQPFSSAFPCISPSPIIKTKKRTPNNKVAEQGSNFIISSQEMESISETLENSRPSSSFQILTQPQDILYITPAQKSPKKNQLRPTPLHLTNTYADIINGKQWENTVEPEL